MIYRTDYHIHTKYSDGGGWPEDYVAEAIRKGLDEIGFSDHFTLTREPQKWSMEPGLLPEYVERIRKTGEIFPEIKVRTGLEVDYFPDMEDEIASAIDGFTFDYIIGSVHYMGNGPVDLGTEYYENKDIDLLFENYFKLVSRAAASGLFDIIGHSDLIRIYGFKPVNDIGHLYRELADGFAGSGVAFELNTNGINKPLGDFYPDRRFLSCFSKAGVPVCVNSDAHKPSRVAQCFDEAYDLLRNAGFSEMARFEKRVRSSGPF